jgi:hypothetical protein
MDQGEATLVLEGLRGLLTAGSFPEFAGATIANAKVTVGGLGCTASFAYQRSGKPVAVDLILLQAPPADSLKSPPAFTLQVEKDAGLFYLDDRGHPWELPSGNAPLAPYPSKLREIGQAISSAGAKKP